MATLYKHGRLRGIYRPKGQFVDPSDGRGGMRLALFENGTVLRRRNRVSDWQLTRFNTARLLAGSNLLVEDLSPQARAIFTRVNAASHVHEGIKKRRVVERRIERINGSVG